MRQTISLALLGVLLLGATGCATIAMPPIMAVTTPISCINEAAKHGSAGEILFTILASPLTIPGGFLMGLAMGIQADIYPNNGKSYGKAFKEAADPCR